MRIQRVGSMVVNAGRRNWVFVRIETDVAGLVGWGEASLEVKTRSVVGAIDDFAPLLLGQDPRRIEHLWQALYRQQYFRGGPVELSALSGIDIALWDILGKELGVPVWRLLGGRVRDWVRFYDHLGGGASDVVYADLRPEEAAERAQESVAAGFDALKILAVPRARAIDGDAALHTAVRSMEAVRSAVGPDVDVMVDLHGRTSAVMAIQFGQALAPYRPWWLEEPVSPDDLDGLVRVADALPGIPIAAGERLGARWSFRQLFERGAVAVAQPDVCHSGGISELRRIGALAEAYGIAMAPHNPLGPIATMANLHLALATPNHLIQEVMRADVPWRDAVVPGVTAIERGRAAPPEAPGIGVEVDEAAAARHPYQQEPQLRWFHDDGSVADW